MNRRGRARVPGEPPLTMPPRAGAALDRRPRTPRAGFQFHLPFGPARRVLLPATLALLALVAWLPGPAAAAASATSARLLLPVEAVKPGETFLAGVELTMTPRWHTYWRHGGDSGAPTTVEWTLPPGFTAGSLQWPPPERYTENDLTTYVYHGTATLLVPISVAPDANAGAATLSALVKWLECEQLCVPGKATIQATLAVTNATRPSALAPLLRTAAERLPKPLPPGTATAAWDGPAAGDERTLLIRWTPPAAPAGTPDFFPLAEEAFEIATATTVERAPGAGGGVVLRKTVRRLEGDWPKQVAGLLLVLDQTQKPLVAFDATLPVPLDGRAAAPPPAAPGGAVQDPEASSRGPRLSLGRAIWLGLLGGLILNIMPCVLPVIALKILGFVRQSGSRPAVIRRLGLVYGVGVWFSFLVLAGAVIGVRSAVGFASWGMQFGNPVFLVAMTTLVLLVALSLFGVFEINLGGRTLDAAGGLARKEGDAGAFFNGMLAVALATPCTAPFLAPALGYAFAADALAILVVFTAVAFGLAAPYVLLSFQPAWLRFVPKPGPWMERFKIAMGFPMLATAVWLFTLAGSRFGDPGPLWLGLFLVGIAVAAWVWGEFAQRGRRRPLLARAVAVGIAALAYAVALERELHWRAPQATAARSTLAATGVPADGIPWEAWSPAAVAAARQAGRPVFVDFTADWCLTCKLNERSSINIPAVREKLRAIQAVTLKGDHTRQPPDITRELLRYGRAGVPLVLVFPRDATRDPVVLPEFLTPDIVLRALDDAAR